MHKMAFALAAGAALMAASAVEARPKLTGEEQLNKLLEGRVAGQPVNCISLFDTRDQQVIDKTAIVYGTGRTIYVNRPMNAVDLDRNDVMVSDVHAGQVCKLDVVRLHDQSGGWYRGFVGLEQFVPYRKVANAN
jgi:hypothetical protein